MAYFSRLTDIVTCNLTSILNRCDNAEKTLEGILSEMSEGAAGAERCVRTAVANVTRLEEEIGEHRTEIQRWVARAQEALKRSDEAVARECLERKHEVEDLIAGLAQQLQAASGTRDHLQTMLCALQARMADARRRLAEVRGANAEADTMQVAAAVPFPAVATSSRVSRVDAEMEELRRQMRQS